MKVTFDIDHLLEQINGKDVGVIIACIDEPEVLDYIAKEYENDDEILRRVRLNSATSKDTIEFIASKVLKSKYPFWEMRALYYDKRLSKETREKLSDIII